MGSQKTKRDLACDPALPILGLYPQILSQHNTEMVACTSVFFFCNIFHTIEQNQCRCPNNKRGGRGKCGKLYAVECFLAIEKNEGLSFTKKVDTTVDNHVKQVKPGSERETNMFSRFGALGFIQSHKAMHVYIVCIYRMAAEVKLSPETSRDKQEWEGMIRERVWGGEVYAQHKMYVCLYENKISSI